MWWAAVRVINHALLSCAKLNQEKEFVMSELGIGACMPSMASTIRNKTRSASTWNGGKYERRSTILSHSIYMCFFYARNHIDRQCRLYMYDVALTLLFSDPARDQIATEISY